MESSKNLLKLAQTIKPILKENDNLPLQQLYLNMLDLDIKNHKAYFANCSLILGRCPSRIDLSTSSFLINRRFINNFTSPNLLESVGLAKEFDERGSKEAGGRF